MNPYRWYEYALSSSIMIVILATFVGESGTLAMIFVLNASMDNVRLSDGETEPVH